MIRELRQASVIFGQARKQNHTGSKIPSQLKQTTNIYIKIGIKHTFYHIFYRSLFIKQVAFNLLGFFLQDSKN